MADINIDVAGDKCSLTPQTKDGDIWLRENLRDALYDTGGNMWVEHDRIRYIMRIIVQDGLTFE